MLNIIYNLYNNIYCIYVYIIKYIYRVLILQKKISALTIFFYEKKKKVIKSKFVRGSGIL